jgi:hypothetical protein
LRRRQWGGENPALAEELSVNSLNQSDEGRSAMTWRDKVEKHPFAAACAFAAIGFGLYPGWMKVVQEVAVPRESVQALENRASVAERRVNDLEAENKRLREQPKAPNEQVADLRRQLSEAKSESLRAKGDLQARIATLEAENKRLNQTPKQQALENPVPATASVKTGPVGVRRAELTLHASELVRVGEELSIVVNRPASATVGPMLTINGNGVTVSKAGQRYQVSTNTKYVCYVEVVSYTEGASPVRVDYVCTPRS